MSVFLFALLLIQYCYGFCDPSNVTCWPSADEIATLQEVLGGELLLPSDDNFNKSNSKNPYIDTRPYFVLLVANKNDIINSLSFVRDHDLELSIFSTGHSTSGRSIGVYNNSFQINFSNKRNIELINYDNNQYAVKVETGANFGEIYSFVNDISFDNAPNDAYLIAGGDCGTVGLAGYSMGGGEPVLLRYLGLGVDSILEYEIIIANGSILIANDTHNTDLFWALRGIIFIFVFVIKCHKMFVIMQGGGGGTFGVVTNITMAVINYEDGKTEENGLTYATATYPFYDDDGGLIGDKILTHFWTKCLTMDLSHKINGHFDISINPTENAYIGLHLLYIGNLESSLNDEGMQCFFDYNSMWQIENGTDHTYYQTYQDWHENIQEDNSWNQYGFDTFVSQENITNNNNEFIQQIVNFTNELLFNVDFSGDDIDGVIDLSVILLGGKAASNDDDVSLNPAWRTPYGLDVYFMALWKNDQYDDVVTSFMNGYSNLFYEYGFGAYFNDDIENNVNWREKYWGTSNYNKLINIKNKFDPWPYLFNCFHCIGDDTETNDEGGDNKKKSLLWLVILLIVIIGLMLIMGILYYVYKRKQKEKETLNQFAMLSNVESKSIN